MPEAFISITTSPGPGVGSGKLCSSTLRSPRKTTPRMRLVLLDALSHLGGVLRQERDVIDRARAPGALRMLLQQELVADLVGVLRREVHADFVARLEPVAGKAEVGPLGDLEAEHVLVEFLRALEILRDQQEMVEFGDRHEASAMGHAILPE